MRRSRRGRRSCDVESGEERVGGGGYKEPGGGPGFCVELLVNGCPTRRSPFSSSSLSSWRWLSRAPCHAVQRRALLAELRVLRTFLDIPVATEAPASPAGPVNPPRRKNFFAETLACPLTFFLLENTWSVVRGFVVFPIGEWARENFQKFVPIVSKLCTLVLLKTVELVFPIFFFLVLGISDCEVNCCPALLKVGNRRDKYKTMYILIFCRCHWTLETMKIHD